jgi:hypothetical protein
MDDIRELYARRKLCLFCIQTVSEVDPSDPRRAGAIEEYNRQLAKIDKRIEAIEGKPPDTVIGLKPAILFPKSEGVNQ